ncbi:hypothetical protein ACS0TY_018005 [Phlomoides rotata]
MEVFSPIVEIQPITTPSLDKLWDDRDGPKKDTDRKPSFLFPSRRFGLSEESANDNHQIFDWKSNSSSKQMILPPLLLLKLGVVRDYQKNSVTIANPSTRLFILQH